MHTQQTLLGRVYDRRGINKKFTQYSESTIDQSPDVMISPCDVEMFQIGLIDKDGTLIGKHGRAVNMQHIFGSQYELFREYAYINFYLRPHNRHFFVAPYDMTISELSLSRGRPYMPWIMGLETGGVPIFKHFVERNAHAGVTCDISGHTVGLVAVGSLNVNRIHIDHQQGDVLTKGEKLGHFLMGSGILLLFPKQQNIHTALYEKVVIGQHLVSMS